MPVIKANEKKNVWATICKEYEEKKNFDKKNQDIVEYDASKHNPVFFGFSFEKSRLDDYKLLEDFDSALSHPASFGHGLSKFTTTVDKIEPTKPLINRNTCTEREFIEHFVFPTLLPAMEKMLHEAKRNRCFERKRTAFNACDFLTEYLFKNNPFQSEEELARRRSVRMFDIPFAKEWLQDHPRPALPKSLLWSEPEAALIIQAFYRGYLVRREPEVQELRQWQRELREENTDIVVRVNNFWNSVPPPPPPALDSTTNQQINPTSARSLKAV